MPNPLTQQSILQIPISLNSQAIELRKKEENNLSETLKSQRLNNIMRPSALLIFLLALHLMICGAYGARLGKVVMKSDTSQESQLTSLENENAMKKLEKNNVHKREIIEVKCEDDEDHCSSKGKNRKLITSTTIPTSIAKPIQEKLDNEGKKIGNKRDDKAQISSPPSSNHDHNPITGFVVDKHHNKEIAPAEYENAMDMTVMDYSPAKRKPPIHN